MATVGDLVNALNYAARNQGLTDSDNTTYSLTEKHLAIQGILKHFVRSTRCTNQTDTVSISANDTTATFGATGFHPERLKGQKLYVLGQKPVEKADLGRVIELQRRYPTSPTGSPRLVAFTSETSALIWPTADASYTLNYLWWPPPTSWTPGDDGAASTVVNVPDDLALAAVESGGVAWLQHGFIEHVPLNNVNRQVYDALVQSSIGRGSIGSDGFQRHRLDRDCWDSIDAILEEWA